MKKIVVDTQEYEVIKDYNNALEIEDLKEKLTEHFYGYDFIVGDYSYDKLRLKGFYEENSKKATEVNNAKDIEIYINNYCNYHAKHFILKNIKK